MEVSPTSSTPTAPMSCPPPTSTPTPPRSRWPSCEAGTSQCPWQSPSGHPTCCRWWLAFAVCLHVLRRRQPEFLATGPDPDEHLRAFGNAIAVAKFCTESVTQSLFALLLARDLSGPAQTVTYTSVGLSLAISPSGSRRLPRRVCLAF